MSVSNLSGIAWIKAQRYAHLVAAHRAHHRGDAKHELRCQADATLFSACLAALSAETPAESRAAEVAAWAEVDADPTRAE